MNRSLPLALLLGILPTTATASPWTLPRGKMVLVGGFDFQLATREFIDRGGERAFPLDGRFSGTTFTLAARIGFSDSFELEASIPVRLVAYTSDPVILRPRTDPSVDEVTYYQQNVVDFSQASAGVGDLGLAGRYRWFGGRTAMATEVRLKAPTGYRGPEGTFGPTPTTIDAFIAQAPALIDPSNVRDDVTLGDAQLDVTASMLFGAGFSSGTFMRIGAGYKLRLGGAGDQVVGDVRVGQSIGGKVLLFASGAIAYSVQRGRVVGISASARDPTLPASAYIDDSNVLLIERRLAYDALDVGGGFIWKMADTVEMNAAYLRTVWGRFTSATNTVTIAIALRASLFDDDE